MEDEKKIWSNLLYNSYLASLNIDSVYKEKSLIILGGAHSGKTCLVQRLLKKPIVKGNMIELSHMEIKLEKIDSPLYLSIYTLNDDAYYYNLYDFVFNKENPDAQLVCIVLPMDKPWDFIKIIDFYLGNLEEYFEVKNSDSSSGSSKFAFPIFFIVTKTDEMIKLERNNNFNDEHFDYILYNIRKIALEYNASVVYTSDKTVTNFDNLYDLLIRELYNEDRQIEPSVLDRQSIFIPLGWDNSTKLEYLIENMNPKYLSSTYETVIRDPSNSSLADTLLSDGAIEDDQIFLKRIYQQLSENSKDIDSTFLTPSKLSPNEILNTNTTTNSSPSNHMRQTNQNTPEKEEVLSNFFSSLLTRKQANMKMN